MTIDEAIQYAEDLGTEEENKIDYDKDSPHTITRRQNTVKDYRQLAEWLRELVAYKKLRICGNCRHYVRGTTHFGECHVTSDIEPCVVGVDQTACDTFFDYKDFRNGV